MVIDGLLLFAAGGILYVVFQDIAPQAKLKKHWLPSLGAVLGFALGLLAVSKT
jgi:ZIP family zinc transporter|tara:strand:+ start:1623 stop:1781 length:159 start_codon:yes stop_codon:yes gene_type:complete